MDSASVYGELVNFDKTAKAPVDIYNEALSSLGISDARTRVNTLRGELTNTEGLLKNVEGNVSQRTSNALVTEAQRQKLVTSERQPLVEQTDILGRNLTNATSNVNDIENQAKTKADLTFTGQQAQRGAIESRYNAAVGKEKAAEDTRQFNASLAVQQQNANTASRSSSGSSTPSKQEEFAAALAARAGGDGKVSPGTYNSLKNQWVAAGYGSYADFHNRFWKQFVNESHWWDYK